MTSWEIIMYKKLLLASLSVLAVHVSQATPPLHVTSPSHPGSENETPVQGHTCPPCSSFGTNGMTGWVLIPAGPMTGTGCKQEQNERHNDHATDRKSEHENEQHNAHASPASQEALIEALKKIKPQLFTKADPYGRTPESKIQEWGKVHDQKVYFKQNGLWVYDPAVNYERDLVQLDHKTLKKTIEQKLAQGHSQGHGEMPPSNQNAKLHESVPETNHEAGPEKPQEHAQEANNAAPSQETIAHARRALHMNQDKVQKWTRFIHTGDKNQWYILENGKWVLWDEEMIGQNAHSSLSPSALSAPSHATSDVRPSLTVRNTQTGPGTYNSKVPGAPGTPEANLNPVNRNPVS
jgi:hypothetical protein